MFGLGVDDVLPELEGIPAVEGGIMTPGVPLVECKLEPSYASSPSSRSAALLLDL